MFDELRKKPSYVRESYAFWGAFLFTGLIASLWLFSLPIRFNEVNVIADQSGMAETSGAFSQFFNELRNSAETVWSMGEEAAGLVEESGPDDSPPAAAGAAPPSSAPAIMIATTSAPAAAPSNAPPSIQIATSSVSDR